jgi:hypothetical protein
LLTRRAGEDPLNIPAVMERVVRIVAGDVAGPLLAAAGVDQHDAGLAGDRDRLGPGSDGMPERPQRPADLDLVVLPGPGQQVRVVARDPRAAAQSRAGQPLGPDAQVVADVADVGAGRPVQAGVPAGGILAVQQARVPPMSTRRCRYCGKLAQLTC